MTDAELEHEVETAPGFVRGQWPVEWFQAELDRRRADEQTRIMVQHTATMVRLTKAIGGMTLVSTVFVMLSALHIVG